MNLNREINFPVSPEEGETHTEYGRTWTWVLAPDGSSATGMWRATGDSVGDENESIGFCWTVDDVKQYLGIEGDDPSTDAKVSGAMKVVQSAMENYCNRLFEYRSNHTEMVYKTKGEGWQLHLWPVVGNLLVSGVPCKEVEVDNQTGVAWFDHYSYTKRLSVTYSGGYKPCDFPPDLMAVLLGSIGAVYQTLQDGGVTNDSAISKITIPDVGTITYDNKTNGEIGSGGAFIGGVIPMHWQSTLDFYRLHEC